MLKAILLAISALLWQTSALADNAPVDDMKAAVRKEGASVVIDLTLTVAATPEEIWPVLVDYDHMPQFLSNVQSSKILEKNGNIWKVAQKGRSSHGVFSFAYETIREIDLKPFESIRAHAIGGTIQKFVSTTRLSPAGAGTLIVYHSESIPNVWMPPVVGTSIVEGEVRKQFQQLETEILRRKASAQPGGG